MDCDCTFFVLILHINSSWDKPNASNPDKKNEKHTYIKMMTRKTQKQKQWWGLLAILSSL